MDKNIATYLCKGCGIGEALDFEALGEVIDEAGLGETKEHDALCSPEGLEMIKADIAGGINTVCIGACSQRVKTDEFNFGREVIVDRVSLREQVVYCTEVPPAEGDDVEEGQLDAEALENRQMLAEDYFRMSGAKIKNSKLPEPYQLEEEVATDIMVVGGGIAGLTAAKEAAAAGSKVIIVEKEAQLGGFLGKMAKLSPQKPPYAELEDTGVAELVAELEANENVTIYTGATVDKTAGSPGNFDVTLSGGQSFRVGAIVQATGWTPYDPENLKEDLAWGTSDKIITNVMMEEKAKSGDLGGLNAVAFIQCAGSRDENHLPYCSAFCCLASIKQAIYVKEANPEAAVFVVYKDVRTPGQTEDVYRAAQRAGVVFIRRDEDYPQISEDGGKLVVETLDVLLQDTVRLEELDLVVLATGMVPNNPRVVDAPLIPFEVPEEQGKKMIAEAKAQNEDWSILNLAYRQGRNLPTLKYKMPDSHFICFPYETRRTGIYTAGCVRRPMRVDQSRQDATGAALKAIQAIYATSKGRAVHPRAGDETFPEFQMTRCTQCKRCTEECPFGAINEDEKANPLPNPTRCRRCGVCMGACPERIISFKNYSVGQIGDMIKSMEIPDEEDEKPRVVVLVCENDALPAIDMAARSGAKWSPFVRFIPVRCLGSVNLVWIADSLSAGVDGVILFGCRRGDDYQCHFVRGSELANVRMSKITETLQRLALEEERVLVEEVSINDLAKIPGVINDFVDTIIDDIGMNPFKGF